jgi:hypothetical protein
VELLDWSPRPMPGMDQKVRPDRLGKDHMRVTG